MGKLIRAHDWSHTPIGPIATWPESLRAAVSICLGSKFPILLWWGPELVMIYNDAYRPILGATKHPRALGQVGRECWPEVWDIIGPMLEETVMRRGEATWSEDQLLLLDRNGYREECYFTFSYSPIRDESGGVGGVFCAVTETTPQVVGGRRLRTLRELAAQVSQATSAHEACLQAVATLARNPTDLPFALIYLTDGDGKQARLVGATGLPSGSAAAPAVICLDTALPPAVWPLAEVNRRGASLLVDAPGGPGSRALVLPIAAPTGLQPVGMIVAGLSPNHLPDDEYQGFLNLLAGHISRAVTHARAYEEERKRAEALAALDRAKTTFFSNISHEFRTPLTLMLGPLNEALDEEPDPPTRRRLELLRRNALRLQKLVNTLLDFAQIEDGRLHAAFVPTDLATLTGDLAGVFRAAVEKAGLRLTVDCPPLPAPVEVDRDMWEKIVLNLLSNALKFTLEGEIEVRLWDAGETVKLAVRDTGCGIPADQLPHIFARFHRIEGMPARTHEGSGIGLAFVQELVALHGGSVTVASTVGQGSTFTVTLPKQRADRRPTPAGAPLPPPTTPRHAVPYAEEALHWLPEPDPDGDRPTAAAAPARGQRILVADDNTDMRHYVRRLLAGKYVVETVADGATALAALRANPPDLVLADVMMPQLDGFGLLRAVRGDPATRTLPVILLSARAGEAATLQGLDAGADTYLVKPFSARELLAHVDAQLELARVRREAVAALRMSDAQLQTLFDEAPLGIYLVDADFRLARINRQAQPAFAGVPDPLGRDFAEIIRYLWGDADGEEVMRRFRHTLATGEPYLVPEWAEERQDRGVVEYYEWQINRIVLPDGRHGVVCYFRDISAQVLARQTIAESEARYRGIVNQSLAGIAEIDPTGHFITVNNRFCQMLGYSPAELRTRRMQEITHPDDLPHNQELFERCCRDGTAFELEKRCIRKDGSTVWIHNSIAAVRDGDGKVRSILAVVLDITARRQADDALRASEQSLREIRQSLEERVVKRTAQVRALAASLARAEQEERKRVARLLHDHLQQMLYSIQMELYLLREDTPAEAADVVNFHLDTLAEMVKDAIHATRTLAVELSPTVLEKANLAEALHWLAGHMQGVHGLVVDVETAGDCQVADPGRRALLFQVVRELLFNIVKHAQVGRGTVRLRCEHDRLVAVVGDRGRGFVPGNFATPAAPTGFGLNGMGERLSLFGGSIAVRSAPGQGTEVTVTLPVGAAE